MKVTVKGVKEIERAFKDLKKSVAGKVVRQAIRAALKPMQAEVKALAPVDTGALKKSVKLRAAASRKRGVIALEVRIGEGDFKGKTFYAAMVEFGTSRQPGQHYMARAFDATADAAVRTARQLILDGIERELSAGNGKGST